MIAINASPRGKNSNTNKLFDYFSRGMSDSFFSSLDLKDYYDKGTMQSLIDAIKEFDVILIGFPLYTDWLPGFVKEFFEVIADNKNIFESKSFMFLIQSGFPEANHSRYVERYCRRFTERLGAAYLGSIVRGSSEGTRLIPEKYFKDAVKLKELGKIFERDSVLDKKLLGIIAKPEKFKGWKLFFFRLVLLTPLFNMYWNSQLKKNKIFGKRFDKPYFK